MIICLLVLLISSFFVFFAMIGYPLLLLLLNKIIKPKDVSRHVDYIPYVTYLIVAHNEENVIVNKLKNAIALDYPVDKFEIIVTSDFSTDDTNSLVERFANDNDKFNIKLYKTKEHKGKTNAQNEAVKISTGEIIVFTDANAILKDDAIKEIVSYFVDDVAYVTGKLVYTNGNNQTSNTESGYWNYDLKMRYIESKLQTITAGNGSLYAVRKRDYVDISLIQCHDSAFPYYYARMKKRAVFNPNAISFEKAGEINRDEFKRKVRMNRSILNIFKDMLMVLNVFKYKWFTLFYFGHRYCRYTLWFNHLIFFITSIVFSFFGNWIIGVILILLQIVLLLLGIYTKNHNIKFKIVRYLGYYSMTVIAQFVGAAKQLIGKSKPVWDTAKTTR